MTTRFLSTFFSSFCSRRLRRIRKSLELTYGNQKKFQKPIITDELVAKDSKVDRTDDSIDSSKIRLILGEANTEPRKKFHLLNRLRKAVKHAEQLETLCNNQKTCDARTKLEVQVRENRSFLLRFHLFSLSGIYSCYEWSFEIRITIME